MENNERDRKLDQWLDEALSDYSAAEPRFGLEQRVLNRIRGEEQRSRKWNVWRWMPAFGAIAALTVVAIAVAPMLEKKVPVRQMNSPIDTYSRPTQEQAKTAGTESLHQQDEVTTKLVKPELNDTVRGASPVRREVARVPQKETAPQGGDQDRLISAQAAKTEDQPRTMRSVEKKDSATADNAASPNNSVAAVTAPPPPPPPVQQVGPGVGGGIAGGTFANAPATAAKIRTGSGGGMAPKLNADAAEAQAAPALLNDKAATESLKSVITKDARRKEAHSKPEASRQDPNAIEAFGVTVRFQNGPATQQFPTPVPLSNQEKLALKAGQQLKDSAVAQHKSTEITPIEIKDVEIKPLEGPEKEK